MANSSGTQQQEETSIASEVLAASIGGAISASILYPLEVLKTKMQAETATDEDEDEADDETSDNKKKSTSMMLYAENLYNTYGYSVFTKGIEFSALQSATEKALYFFAYTALKKMVVGNNTNMDTGTNLLLGCMAEWLHLPVTLPLDCWTTAIQTNQDTSKNGMELLVTLLSEKGLKGMYKGIGAYVVLCLKPAIQYTVFEQLRHRLLKNNRHQSSLSAAQAFVLGMVARTISTVLVFPYLRAKVILQTASSSSSNQNTTTIVDVLKTMKGGELFRGLGPELTRGVLSSALMLMIKERIASVVYGMLHGV